MSIDLEETARKLAPRVTRQLHDAAKPGGTEADFRREAARIFEEARAEAGLPIVPRDEFSVARGRVDSVYNRLVLEYKRPGVLTEKNGNKANKDVIQQVKDYILDVAKKEKREANRLAGAATDGFFLIFVRREVHYHGKEACDGDPVLRLGQSWCKLHAGVAADERHRCEDRVTPFSLNQDLQD